jgi:calcineurin-like phosphoesterase family protein
MKFDYGLKSRFDQTAQPPKICDWYDGWIEEAEEMKIRIVSDTHWNAELKVDENGVCSSPIMTGCKRPMNFTKLSIKRWQQTVQPTDFVWHLGDVINGPKREVKAILADLPGRKGLVRGNHDRDKSCGWWMENGFDIAVDHFVFRNILFTHEPANAIVKSNGNRPYGMLEEGLPYDTEINIHGHLHNVWDGFMDEERWKRDKELLGIDFKKQLRYPWQRLFAIEYTNYGPVELNEFLAHPQRYQATGPKAVEDGGL